MGLDTLIRSGVALAKRLTSSLQVSVTHKTVTARDTYGKVTGSSSVSRQALLEDSKRLIRYPGGVEKQARAKLTFLENVAIDVNDTEFTLPDGTTGPILDIRGLSDPTSGRYLTEVWLG